MAAESAGFLTVVNDSNRRNEALERISRYARILGWLIRDLIRSLRTDCLVTVCSGVLGILLQGWTVALLIVYAGKLEAGTVIRRAGLELDARSPAALSIIGIATLAALGAASLLLFAHQRSLIETGYKYENRCRKKVFSSLGIKVERSGLGKTGMPGDAQVLQLGLFDATQVSRVVRLLLMTPVHFATFVIATGVMFFLSTGLSLAILPVMCLGGVYLYRLNIRAAAVSLEYEKVARAGIKEIRKAFQLLKESDRPIDPESSSVAALLHSDPVIRAQKVNQERVLVPQRAQLASNLLLAVCLAAIMQYYGLQVLTGNTEHWGHLVGYLLALRYSLVSLRSLASQFTSLNRFYPNLRRFYEFLTADEHLPAGRVDSLTVATGKARHGQEEDTVELSPGTVVGLVTSAEVNRYTIPSVAAGLAESAGCASDSLLATSGFVLQRSAELTGLPVAIEKIHQRSQWEHCVLAGDLADELAGNPLWPWLVAEVPALQRRETALAQLKITNESVRFVINAIALKRSGKRILFVDERGVRALPPRLKSPFVQLFGDRLVFIAYGPRFGAMGRYSEHFVLVLTAQGLQGVLRPPYVAASLKEIRGLLAGSRPPGRDLMREQWDDVVE